MHERDLRRRSGLTRPLLLALLIGCDSPRRDPNYVGEVVKVTTDTAFSALQERGKAAMGVDQYTSAHVFEPLPDGGRIVLRRTRGIDTANDSAFRAEAKSVATIRAHMKEIAAAFGRGDFAIPGAVHAMSDVPGTAEMHRLRAEITYDPRELPNGGEVRITARSAAALKAVHEFLAFQRTDHRAGMH